MLLKNAKSFINGRRDGTKHSLHFFSTNQAFTSNGAAHFTSRLDPKLETARHQFTDWLLILWLTSLITNYPLNHSLVYSLRIILFAYVIRTRVFKTFYVITQFQLTKCLSLISYPQPILKQTFVLTGFTSNRPKVHLPNLFSANLHLWSQTQSFYLTYNLSQKIKRLTDIINYNH